MQLTEVLKRGFVKDFIEGKRESIYIDCLEELNWNKRESEELVSTIAFLYFSKNKKNIYVCFIGKNPVISTSKRKINVLRKRFKRAKYYNKEKEIINKNFSIGEFLDYPICCIKKYVEDTLSYGQELISMPSAVRYLSELRGRDLFGISTDGDVTFAKYGFIPCSYNCPQAIKFIKKLR
jgi:hypothetical protein